MRKLTVIRFTVVLVLLSTIIAAAGCSSGPKAPAYPERPIELTVGFAPGGVADPVMRGIADAAKAFLPQPVVVINKEGASGSIGVAAVYKSKPDGYSIGGFVDTDLSIKPMFMPDLPYRSPADFTIIIRAISVAEVFVVNPKVPYQTMKDLLDYARANPGKIRVADSGIATTGSNHLKDLEYEAKVSFTEVPFAGGNAAITALLGGHIDGGVFALQPAVLGNVRAGTMKIIGIYTAQRIPELPDVPTLKELGYNTMTQGSFYYVAGPKGMPSEIVDILYDAFKKSMQTDNYQKFMKDNIYTTDFKGKADLAKEIQDSYNFYGEAVKKWGLKK